MKALSLTQPWATLVAIEAKKIETRGWSTAYRGPLAIHATKSFPPWAQLCVEEQPFWDRLRAARYHTYNLPRGALVATCHLVDVVQIQGTQQQPLVSSGGQPIALSSDELAFGDFEPGRYAWILADVARIEPPAPCSGARGLWELAR